MKDPESEIPTDPHASVGPITEPPPSDHPSKPAVPDGAQYFDWALTKLSANVEELRKTRATNEQYRHELMDPEGWLAKMFERLRQEARNDTDMLRQEERSYHDKIVERLNHGASVMTSHMLMIGELQGRPPNGLTGRKILVVEDEPLLLKVIAQALISRGARPFTADGPEEAMKIAAAVQVDAALVDLNLPPNGVESGYALIDFLHRTQPSMGLVLMTGYPREYVSVPYPDVPVFILEKPFELEAAEKMLHEAIDAGAARAKP